MTKEQKSGKPVKPKKPLPTKEGAEKKPMPVAVGCN